MKHNIMTVQQLNDFIKQKKIRFSESELEKNEIDYVLSSIFYNKYSNSSIIKNNLCDNKTVRIIFEVLLNKESTLNYFINLDKVINDEYPIEYGLIENKMESDKIINLKDIIDGSMSSKIRRYSNKMNDEIIDDVTNKITTVLNQFNTYQVHFIEQ